MPVRTKRLAAGISGAAGAFGVVYTCPANETTIVKEVMLSNALVVSSRFILNATAGAAAVTVIDMPTSAGQAWRETMWFVMQPGDTLSVYSAVAAAVRYWISGTQLEGVAD